MRQQRKPWILSLLIAFTAVLLLGAALQSAELVKCPV